MRARPWSWLRNAIEGLLDRPPGGYLELRREGTDEPYLHPLWTTRVQHALPND